MIRPEKGTLHSSSIQTRNWHNGYSTHAPMRSVRRLHDVDFGTASCRFTRPTRGGETPLFKLISGFFLFLS